jgi:hypothetical protein
MSAPIEGGGMAQDEMLAAELDQSTSDDQAMYMNQG